MKPLYFSILIVLLLASPVLAQGCASPGFMGTLQTGQNVVITETCPTCNFINITIKNEHSEIIISNQPMTLINGTFTYILSGNYTKGIGTFFIEGFSNLDLPVKACFDTNPTGTLFDNLWMNFLIVFLLSSGSFVLVGFFNESRSAIRHGTENNFVYYYLGSFMLISIGVYVIISGFGGYENILTTAFGYINWGAGLFFLTRPFFVGGKWVW